MSILKLKRDRNGNRIISIKVQDERAFSIQTNGNLPDIHRMDVLDIPRAKNELYLYGKRGILSERQNTILKHYL